MIQRGQLQLRGMIRWQVRRLKTRLRYGPAKVDRLPVVIGNAIPKNGSKLLFNILRGLPGLGPFIDTGLNAIKPNFQGAPTAPEWIARQLTMLRPGDVRFAYLHATPQNVALACRSGRVFFQILRDPRDSVVSGIFYALEIHTRHIMHNYYLGLPGMEERISTAIAGIPEGKYRFAGIGTVYGRYLGWLDQPQVCVLRFEDLVARREAELARILDHLGKWDFQPEIPRQEAIQALSRQMDPKKSETFRKGRSGGWVEHFTARNKAEFKAATGDLLIRLGYERDANW